MCIYFSLRTFYVCVLCFANTLWNAWRNFKQTLYDLQLEGKNFGAKIPQGPIRVGVRRVIFI